MGLVGIMGESRDGGGGARLGGGMGDGMGDG